jgi:hypothetical protein
MLEVAVVVDSPPCGCHSVSACQPWRRDEQGEDRSLAAATKNFLKGIGT